MFRIRFHGRGGQGVKTASRILGSAFFKEGFEVQDAPLYGAERRGAPIFAYVRADHSPINERGVMPDPDLVVVTDDSLFSVPMAGVLRGVAARTTLLLNSRESAETWRHRLNLECTLHCLPDPRDPDDLHHAALIGAACVGAAVRLLGVVSWDSLAAALDEELSFLDAVELRANREAARAAFDRLRDLEGTVIQREAMLPTGGTHGWVDLPFEAARVSAPAIHGAATSVEVKTGLWRTMRPVIEHERCHRCWWICSTFCPDGAIAVGDDGSPSVDYDHCKGCLVCVTVCPHHAITAVPEVSFRESPEQGAR